MCENSKKEDYQQKVFCSFSFCTIVLHCVWFIAVFADDFVEEKDPVIDNGDVKPVEAEVVWNKENFGTLVKEGTLFSKTSIQTDCLM